MLKQWKKLLEKIWKLQKRTKKIPSEAEKISRKIGKSY